MTADPYGHQFTSGPWSVEDLLNKEVEDVLKKQVEDLNKDLLQWHALYGDLAHAARQMHEAGIALCNAVEYRMPHDSLKAVAVLFRRATFDYVRETREG
jgi:hypothetical protein